jgi:hypothetical protein
MRSTIGSSLVSGTDEAAGRSALQVLEQARLEGLDGDPAGRRDESPHLRPPDVPSPAELDALKPAVSGRKWTFAAARRSTASVRVIQSDAAGIVQSSAEADPLEPPDDALPEDALPEDEPPELEPPPGEDPSDPDDPDGVPWSPSPVDDAAAAFVLVELPRSFFAQPLPLKTMAGAAMALRRAWA